MTVESCTPISDEEFYDLYQRGIFGSCGTPDPTKIKQRYLWKFSKPLRFETPRPYTHPQGAQIWVNITSLKIAKRCRGYRLCGGFELVEQLESPLRYA